MPSDLFSTPDFGEAILLLLVPCTSTARSYMSWASWECRVGQEKNQEVNASAEEYGLIYSSAMQLQTPFCSILFIFKLCQKNILVDQCHLFSWNGVNFLPSC